MTTGFSALPADQPISDIDLHGFVDGTLTPDRRAQVERYLALNPDDAARIAAYRRQNVQLRLFDAHIADTGLDRAATPVAMTRLARHVDRRMARHRHLRAWGGQVALASVIVAATVASTTHVAVPRQPPILDFALVQQAILTHGLTADEAVPQITAGRDLPDLSALGLIASGHRTLLTAAGLIDQHLFVDEAGASVSVFVATDDTGIQPLHVVTGGPVPLVHWRTNGVEIGITGSLDEAALLDVAEAIRPLIGWGGTSRQVPPQENETTPGDPTPAVTDGDEAEVAVGSGEET